MTSPSPAPASPPSGGLFIALGAIGGTVVGLFAGQPSIGLLVGLAAGVAAAVVLWLRSR
jgi:hypothetical protein